MSGGRQYRETLQYQLRFTVDRKKYPTAAKRDDAVARARAYFLRTGKELQGVKIQARWRNPENANERHANWKTTEDWDQNLFDFWATLGRGRGALR